MANPIAVKGVRQLISELADQVLPNPRVLQRLPSGSLEASGKLRLTGRYGFDRNRELGFTGRVISEVSPAAPFEAEVRLGTETVRESEGDGILELTYSIRFTANTEDA